MTLHGQQLIGGLATAKGSSQFVATAPSTGDALPTPFMEATEAEIDAALELASAAHPAFETAGRERRAACLQAVADGIERLGEELIDRAHAESGLPRARLEGERARTTGQLRAFATLLETADAFDVRVRPGSTESPELRTIDRAIGPVAVFGASNFPLAFSVAGGDTAAALAAGCPVVVKAHPAHPGTSELVAGAVRDAVQALELPVGTFALLQGRAYAVGEALVRHPRLRAVAFTGSYAGGRALFDLAQRRPTPIPVFAEMGSVNPVFVLPSVARRSAPDLAQQLAHAVCLGVGQFCTNPGIVVVRSDTAGAFLESMAAAMRSVAPGVMLHEGIANAYEAGCRALARTPGVELVTMGDGAMGPGANGRPQLFRVEASTFLETPSLRDEVFGPSTMVVECDSDGTMLEVAESFEGQLTGTLHADGSEHELAGLLMRALEQRVGRVVFGGVPTGVAVCEAMHHGGPFPSTTTPRETSVGARALRRFLRPVCYQGVPTELLPADLRGPR